ncbi:hypothetical protein COLO4_10948 [Corchorus olitorius]|uniref:Uncharacterized protein n=1 Tax=Corchorus olitorius TaxID=93759 RepID=A0A1R3K6C0_9ROSI|nr:hypothetical protein COLO4_10948 [Corchorus olitorius]
MARQMKLLVAIILTVSVSLFLDFPAVFGDDLEGSNPRLGLKETVLLEDGVDEPKRDFHTLNPSKTLHSVRKQRQWLIVYNDLYGVQAQP